MAGPAGGALQRLWAALRAGGPESGWLDRLITSAVIVGMLVTARPAAAWVWVCWGDLRTEHMRERDLSARLQK